MRAERPFRDFEIEQYEICMKGDGMITLVTGGSGSGKSAYAEDVAVSAEGTEKYYIATMQIYDAEGERKVERHRKLRAGKGFTTVGEPSECRTGCISNILERKNGRIDCPGARTKQEETGAENGTFRVHVQSCRK